MERTTKSNLNNLITLTRVLKYVGLSPYYKSNERIYTKSKLQMFCAALYIFAILMITLAFAKTRLAHYAALLKYNVTECILDSICLLLMTLVKFVTIFNTNFFNNAKYLNTLNGVLQIQDRLSEFGIKNISISWYFCVEIILIHSMCLFLQYISKSNSQISSNSNFLAYRHAMASDCCNSNINAQHYSSFEMPI